MQSGINSFLANRLIFIWSCLPVSRSLNTHAFQIPKSTPNCRPPSLPPSRIGACNWRPHRLRNCIAMAGGLNLYPAIPAEEPEPFSVSMEAIDDRVSDVTGRGEENSPSSSKVMSQWRLRIHTLLFAIHHLPHQFRTIVLNFGSCLFAQHQEKIVFIRLYMMSVCCCSFHDSPLFLYFFARWVELCFNLYIGRSHPFALS